MSHFPQYNINPTNSETNQFNMQVFDANMLKNLIENNSNVLTQNLNPQDVTYMQQNKMPNQYIIQLSNNNAVPIQQPYMQMMPFPYGNMYYVNQPTQFTTNESGVQYNATPVLPIQLSAGVMQVDVNDLNKINQQNTATNLRSRKRSYSIQIKQENEALNDQNEVLRDTRNRPLLYSCSDCSRKFSMQSRLTQHKKCHSGIRPYACSSCSFAFTQKSYLVRHAAVHKEERPYVCELCQKTYKHYGSLANHRKTHKNGAKTNERPINNDNNVLVDVGINCKTEEVVDINNNDTKSYVSAGNNEYMFQNQPEMQQQTDQNQSFNTQFTTDISTDLFSNSFQSQLSANLTTDINPSFINQLNFHNSNNFYSLIDASTNETVKIEMSNHQDVQISDLTNNNNSSISIESSQPLNLT